MNKKWPNRYQRLSHLIFSQRLMGPNPNPVDQNHFDMANLGQTQPTSKLATSKLTAAGHADLSDQLRRAGFPKLADVLKNPHDTQGVENILHGGNLLDMWGDLTDQMRRAGFPKLAEILADPLDTRQLENILRNGNLLRMSDELGAQVEYLSSQLKYVSDMHRLIDKEPIAQTFKQYTEARLSEEYPTINAHVMHLLGNAVGYEDLIRQLVVHHNWEGIEGHEIGDILYQIEELRNTLRGLAQLDPPAKSGGNGNRPLRAA